MELCVSEKKEFKFTKEQRLNTEKTIRDATRDFSISLFNATFNEKLVEILCRYEERIFILENRIDEILINDIQIKQKKIREVEDKAVDCRTQNKETMDKCYELSLELCEAKKEITKK